MKRRITIITLATLASLLLATGLLLPRLAAPVVERALPGQLERLGATATWSELRLSWTGKVTLQDLELRHPELGLTLSSERITLNARTLSLLSSSPELTSLQVQNAALTLDDLTTLRRHLDARAETPDADAASPADDSPSPDAGTTRARIDHLLKNLPDVSIDALAIHLGQGTSSSSQTFSHIELRSTGEDWELNATAALPTALMPFTKATELPLRGTLSPGARDAQVSVGDPDSDALHLSGPGGSEVRVGQVHLDAAGRTLTLAAVDASLTRAPLRARVSLPTLRLKPGSQAPLFAELDRPLIELVRASADASDPEQTAEPDPAKNLGGARQAGLLDLLRELAWATELRATDGAIFLPPAADAHDPAPQALLEGATLHWLSGQLLAFADTERGRALARAELSPASLLPRYVRLHIEGVSLDALPGLTTQRTLPRRGFRGQFGGEIDLFVEAIASFDAIPDALEPERRYALRSAVNLREAWIDTEALADDRLEGLNLSAHGLASLNIDRPSIRTDNARVSFRGVDARLDAELDLQPGQRTLSLGLSSPGEIPCQSLIGAVPEALLGVVALARVDGEVTPSLSLILSEELSRVRLRITGFEETPCRFTGLRIPYASRAQVAFNSERASVFPTRRTLVARDPHEALPESLPPARHQQIDNFLLFGPPPEVQEQPMPEWHRFLRDVGWLNGPFVKKLEEGVSEDANVRVGPGTSSYVPLDELPGYVGGAMYLSEDMLFYSNRSLSTALLNRALRMNISRSRYVYGGSTLTQQLVKNLFLTRDKTLSRKIQEVIIAWRVDEIVPKERVLELYLNVIEFAPDVYGIGPAARFYFEKDARELTPLEAIFLANLKPAPWEGPRLVRRGRTPEKGWWIERTAEIGQRLVEYNYLTPAQAAAMAPHVLTWSEARMELERQRYREERERERARELERRRQRQRDAR